MKKILYILLFFTFLNANAGVKAYKMDGGTFDVDVYVVISEDTAGVKCFMLDTAGIEISGEDLDARALTFYSYGSPIVMWFPEYPKPEILNHELMHAVIFIMQWAGVPLDDSSNEVYAYEIQYLTMKFYRYVR